MDESNSEKKLEDAYLSVDKNIYKRFELMKGILSYKTGKNLTWSEFFSHLLNTEKKVRNQSSWIYTIKMFFLTTIILMFPLYLNPILAFWLMPVLLIIGFIIAYTSTYIVTLIPIKGIILFKDAPPKILDSIQELSKMSEIDKPIKLMIIETEEVNAMVYSNIKEHIICVTRGLINNYQNGNISEDEMKAILSHEIGHIVNLDGLKKQLTLSFVSIFDMIGNMWMFIGDRTINMGRSVDRREEEMGLVGLAVVLLGWALYLSGIFQKLIAKVASIVSFKISRINEYCADDVGAELSSPESMASALQKLTMIDNKLDINRLMQLPYADRWAVEPANPSWIDKLFHTHPPIEERGNRLIGIKKYVQND